MSTVVHTPEDTRRRILGEAERLFRHYGYSKTTIADIAEACGMSSANVYRFFSSKLAIVEAICDLVTSNLEVQLHKVVTSDAPASKRLSEFIALISRHTVETLLDEKEVNEIVVVAMEEHWAAIKRHLKAVETMMAKIIEDGITSGEFRRQDPMLAARCSHAAMSCFCHPALVAQCMDDPDRATLEEITDFILTALKA